MEKYWSETPKIFRKRVEVYQEMLEERVIEVDAVNYNLGIYIAMAVNNPRKYPKKPYMSREKVPNKTWSTDDLKNYFKRLSNGRNN